MTAIELYKFIHENEIEWHWESNDGKSDVIIFPNFWAIEALNKLLKGSFDDGGIECHMMDGYFAFWMNDICSYYGIELEEIFGKDPTHTE